jgi:hypothetical protein
MVVRHHAFAMSRAFALATAVWGCHDVRVPHTTHHPPAPVAGWTYEVEVAPHGDTLALEAAIASGSDDELTVDVGGEPFVRNVEVLDGDRWRAIAPDHDSWRVRACVSGCRIRYQFLFAYDHGAAIETYPSQWLLRPRHAAVGTPFRFHVATSAGDSFASGVFPVVGSQDTYGGGSGPTFQLPYAALGSLHLIDEGHVQIAIVPRHGRFPRNEADIGRWVANVAKAVEAFYGRPPVPRLLVLVHTMDGRGTGEGRTIGNAGAAIAIDVGEDSTPEDLDRDWVLIHEMIHTALPNLAVRHHWLEEGLATYLEPLVRVRAGLKGADDMWRDWLEGMRNGLPQAGDQGLDRTDTWGRTFWGGALFCLLVDVEIRARTGGSKSLDDGLRGVLAAGGSIATSWTIDRVIEVADRATGVTVLRELYDAHAMAAVPVDLAALWKRLGVGWDGQRVITDDAAPLAPVRRAMTARSAS